MTDDIYDLAIIGGGINGCGIARDAAGRGLSVFLCEKGDLGQGTSSASTKLIHGGLRYLEHYEFGLVREALKEREVLLNLAPHIIWPLRFVLPHHDKLRPRWLIRLGLFLYDHIGGRDILEATRVLDLHQSAAGNALQEHYRTGFEYSDCWVDDARLVVLNAMDAAERGAIIAVRTECVSARRVDRIWRLNLNDHRNNENYEIGSRVLVNAAGPWVSNVLSDRLGIESAGRIRLVKGSHIVVKRLYDHDHAYIFQNDDERVVFIIPFEQDFSLIGTTDEDFDGDPSECAISPSEIDYLCHSVNAYLREPISREQIVWSFSGVRPLYDDGTSTAQETTRDYVLDLRRPDDGAPLVNIFGGKITTFRRLAESVLEQFESDFPGMKARWTHRVTYAGGDFSLGDIDSLQDELQAEWPFLSVEQVARFVRTYGTRCRKFLAGATSAGDLGPDFGSGLTAKEIDYLQRSEWAITAEDILWRRTKLGLRLSDRQIAELKAYLASSVEPKPISDKV